MRPSLKDSVPPPPRVYVHLHTCPPRLSPPLPPFDRETCVFHAVSRVTMRSSLHLAAKSRGGEGKGGPAVETTRTTEEEGGGRRREGKRPVRARVHRVYLCAAHTVTWGGEGGEGW